MKVEKFNYDSGNLPQNTDIVNGLLAIPFFASRLDSIEQLIADLDKKITIKSTAVPSNNFENANWRSRELVSLKECAAILNQSEKTIKNLVKRGLLEQSRATRHMKITTRSLIEFVDRTV
jgi:hypothetical protein